MAPFHSARSTFFVRARSIVTARSVVTSPPVASSTDSPKSTNIRPRVISPAFSNSAFSTRPTSEIFCVPAIKAAMRPSRPSGLKAM
jgi:hypothetical protein